MNRAMIEKVHITVLLGAEYSDNEGTVIRDELDRFFDEYFGDEMWIESFETEKDSQA